MVSSGHKLTRLRKQVPFVIHTPQKPDVYYICNTHSAGRLHTVNGI